MTVDEMLEQGFYSSHIGVVQKTLKDKDRLKARERQLTDDLKSSQKLYVDMIDAQKLLSVISDENTAKTLDFVTSMVNKVLSEMFAVDTPRITLTKKLYAGSKPHINVELIDGKGNTLDMALQAGAGISQVVSFMFAICLIEIRKGRRLLILDERLNGLHFEAKRVLSEVIKIFAAGGFQFMFVEYGLNNIGKIYNVEKRGDSSNLVSLEKGQEYSDTVVFLSDEELSTIAANGDGEE